MAPEQWAGKATAQSDVYSLGVVLFELLTGQVPYPGKTPGEVVSLQIRSGLPPLRALDPVIERGLIRPTPVAVWARYHRGIALRRLGLYAAAIEIQQSLQLTLADAPWLAHDPEGLKASILQEQGRSEEAEQALQSTLFLDGDFALARVMLGAIARSQARTSEAAKHFREALALLEQMPSDSVLAETNGLTAGEMVETVASLIESERVS